jgi:penicillin G amidase
LKRLLVTSLLVLIVALIVGGWWWTRQSLPLLDGELVVSGLYDPVEVVFDGHGVPHVYARDPEDAWFAAGVLHARDRFWQMELYRRVTAGRLSEVLGDTTLAIDQRYLTLDLRAAADAEWQRAEPALKSALERYAAGVNAVSGGWVWRQRPLELQLLGIEPAPWTPVDSLAVARLLAWRLGENHQAELVRAAVAAKLGPDAARVLTGRYPSDAPTVIPDGPRPAASPQPPAPTPPAADSVSGVPDLSASGGGAARAAWPAGLAWLHPMARPGNSNAWVVSGQRTASGRPILANDPHLLVEFPALWYELHLVAAGLDVIGVTLPGVPFVAIGHNRQVAWGFTASGADVQDLSLERIDVARKRVLGSGGWQPARVTTMEIPVKGRNEPVPFEVWQTPRGPIFADAGLEWEAPPAWLTPGVAVPDGQVSAYALRWTGTSGDIASGFQQINTASGWDGFVAALDRLDSPSLNALYADRDGNIGYALNGRLPVRAAGDGATPLSGGSGWVDGASRSALPRLLNPETGYIASANNEIDRRLSGAITRDWIAPYRATRLQQALSSARGVSMDEMAALQTDTRSLAAARVLAGVKDALAAARAQQAEPLAIDALTALAGWDFVVDARPVVTLYQAFEDALWRRTFVDEMDEPLFRAFYQWAGAERPAGLHAIIDERQSRWFDDIATVERRESRDDIFILAARDAAARVDAEFGSGAARAWDRVHAVTFEHALGSGSRILSWFFSKGPIAMVGDGTTVMRVSWNRARPFAAWEAPSWRQLIDVGEWDQSRAVLPAGQAGHAQSAHYFDQNELWRSGRYRPQPFSRQAVVAAQAHRLVLVP